MRSPISQDAQPATTTHRATVVAGVEEAIGLYLTALKEAERPLTPQRKEDLRRLRALCAGVDALPLLLYELSRYAANMTRRRRSFCQWVRRARKRSYLADLIETLVHHHRADQRLQESVEAHEAAMQVWQDAWSRVEAEHRETVRRHQVTIQELLKNNRDLEEELACCKKSLRGAQVEVDPASPFRSTPAVRPPGRRLARAEDAASSASTSSTCRGASMMG